MRYSFLAELRERSFERLELGKVKKYLVISEMWLDFYKRVVLNPLRKQKNCESINSNTNPLYIKTKISMN